MFLFWEHLNLFGVYATRWRAERGELLSPNVKERGVKLSSSREKTNISVQFFYSFFLPWSSDLPLPRRCSAFPLSCSPPPPREPGGGLVSGPVLLADLQPGRSSVGAGGEPIPHHAHTNTTLCAPTVFILAQTADITASPWRRPFGVFWVSAHVRLAGWLRLQRGPEPLPVLRRLVPSWSRATQKRV